MYRLSSIVCTKCWFVDEVGLDRSYPVWLGSEIRILEKCYEYSFGRAAIKNEYKQ